VARNHLLVGQGAGQRRPAVVHLDPELHPGRALPHAFDAVAEARVEDERLGVGVVQQVEQLVVEVAVVDVDGHAAELHAGELGFHVLVRVPEVEADLGVAPEARTRERGGQPRRPLLVLAPGTTQRSGDHGLPVADGVGDGLP
jgi:hypothetical protein